MNKKKIFYMASVFVVLLVSNFIIAQTATAPSGAGTSGNPYQIATLENLYWITQDVTRWNDHYIQTANIDANTTSGWDGGNGFTPIGNAATNFTGSYDGDGYTIDGLTINRSGTDYVAFIGYANRSGSLIKDLGLTNVNISGGGRTAALVGQSDGTGAIISHCYVAGGSIVSNANLVAGLVSFAKRLKIEYCYTDVSVSTSGNYAAGLIGYMDKNAPTSLITNCYTIGTVSGTSGNDSDGAAGLISYNYGYIDNCFSLAIVNSDHCGGFAYINSGTIENCYSAGAVSGLRNSGFVEVGGTLSNCFFDIEASGSANGGGTGKTTAEMKTATTFTSAGWDFVGESANGTNNYWEVDAIVNNGYPFLVWHPNSSGTYRLTINTDGNGTVIVNPVKEKYDINEVVTLTVIPNAGYAFNYWEGGADTNWNDSMLPKKINMDEDKSITAYFTEAIPAFPGAEGGGAYTKGGRGGAVIEVTNLNADGAGSFREACLTEGARTIVFRVGGTIDLGGQKIILENTGGQNYDNLTIAGQTAPGGGIQIKNGTLNMSINDVIIRYVRFRTGSIDNNPTNLTASAPDRYDRRRNYIFDHVSAFWGVNKTIVLGGFTDNVTIQWSIVAEGLHRSLYTLPESWEPYQIVDGVKYWEHSRGLMVHEISRNVSMHHNLLYNFYKRNPLVQSSDADVVNNVIVNKQYQTYVQPFKGQVRANFIGNYYRSYVHIRPPIRVYDYDLGWDSVSTCYYQGNYDVHFRPNLADPETNIRILHLTADTAGDGHISDRATPFVFNGIPITSQDVHTAYSNVLTNVGASLPSRDATDTRVVNFVQSGGAPSAFVNNPSEVGGWSTIANGTPPVDTDHDGMPDSWENSNGLNPNDSSDRNGTNLSGEGYTNLEVYLNGLVSALPVELISFTAKKDGDEIQLSWKTATEINNYGFEIEASNTSSDKWKKIGFVEGHGNSNLPNSYSFMVKSSVAEVNHRYRLKQIDSDGSFEYSNIVSVKGRYSNKLSQNYPNPFNPTTTISFSIAEAGQTKISIFNILGQEVFVVVNKKLTAGKYIYHFSGSDLSSGVYFYKLQAGNYSSIKKMLLLK